MTNANEYTPKLSLVILCYRSGEFAKDFVYQTVAVFEEEGISDYELILVGNYVEGSDDIELACVVTKCMAHIRHGKSNRQTS